MGYSFAELARRAIGSRKIGAPPILQNNAWSSTGGRVGCDVIKENRTYDQVFGDLAAGDQPKGKGGPSLCMFPRNVTPNHHKLAEQFVLLDNMYCNGQVSRDGHPWSIMAYNTDYNSRDWHLTYSQRLGVDDDDEGELSNAPSGYLWDACMRAGVSYRNYKEYGGRVSDEAGNTKMEGRVPGLVGHMCPDFGNGKGRERDMDLIEIMLAEYRQFVEKKNMPKFIMMSLGEDHTDGTRLGSFTPQAYVDSNDIALGKLVDAVSHGSLWAETAIVVIEDDAQNGPDHIDLEAKNNALAYGADRSMLMDFTEFDRIDDFELNEILWHSIMGVDAPTPPAVRRAIAFRTMERNR